MHALLEKIVSNGHIKISCLENTVRSNEGIVIYIIIFYIIKTEITVSNT